MSDGVDIIRKLYEVFLRRQGQPEEVAAWAEQCQSLANVANIIDAFAKSEERRQIVGVEPGHPPGHFYSPIHDPALIQRERLAKTRGETTSIPGIDLRLADQRSLWSELVALPNGIVHTQTPGRRYFHDNQVYGPGDALVLAGMLGKFRPRRVIEIGSGFSSACMLDAAEEHGLQTHFTFIEPYPMTLFWHLTEQDREACRVIQSPVQNVDLAVFDELQSGDFLFIDSTHVMKSGSDVNFELFEILPRLKPGVIVHFHDTFWPFEYPTDWLIHLRYAWNELYGLRAFLMYNDRVSMLFFNDAFAHLCGDAVDAAPEAQRHMFTKNPGGGLWLRVQ